MKVLQIIKKNIKRIIVLILLIFSKNEFFKGRIEVLMKEWERYRASIYQKKMKRLIDKYGNIVLAKLNKISLETSKPIWVEFGTLLGAYRENRFIEHDYDIDCGMYFEDFDEVLEERMTSEGFKKVRSLSLCLHKEKPVVTETTWSYKGLLLDIFLSLKKGEDRYVYVYCPVKDKEVFSKGYWEAREYQFPTAEPYNYVYINSIKIKAPNNIKRCLVDCYGENFMIPDKNYSSETNPNRKTYDLTDAYGYQTLYY